MPCVNPQIILIFKTTCSRRVTDRQSLFNDRPGTSLWDQNEFCIIGTFYNFLLPLDPHKLRKLVKVRGTDPFLSWALSDPTFEARLVIYSNHERNISESFIRFQTSSSQSLGAQSLSSLLIWAGGRSDRARPPAHVLLAPFLNRRLPVKRRDMNQIAHVVENLWLPSTPRHPSLFFSNLK